MYSTSQHLPPRLRSLHRDLPLRRRAHLRRELGLQGSHLGLSLLALLLRCVCDLSIFTREKEQIRLPIRPEGADEYRYVAGQFLPRE